MKFVYWCFSFFVYVLSSSFVYASNEFQTDYDLVYAINPQGVTTVTQKITLTNTLPNFYPQRYSLLIDSDKIANIIAYDGGGIITPNISVLDGKTQINLTFNTKNVGLGSITKLTLRYTHSGIAEKNGSIWEIYIPGVVNDPDIDRYDVTLSVPDQFGPVAYLSPKPKTAMTWDRDQMIRGGIAGAYGKSQIFALKLSYELFNTSSQSHVQQIALPPDTAYQKVIIDALEPKPLTVDQDDDGNWLASFSVSAKSSVKIQANLRTLTYLNPRIDFPKSEIDPSVYLTSRNYWETSDAKILDLAKRYATPRAIYDYVVNTLEYDVIKKPEDITRLGAIGALSTPQSAVCMEFTDLFIAIARAAGIPARRLVGYAHTNNTKLRPVSLFSDVLHAWPEYYDTQTKRWIPIDPTWADTTGGLDYFEKLDFNHIVFSIHGTDSSLPYPAGFYHDPRIEQKDVSVTFAKSEEIFDQSKNIHTSIIFPQRVTAGLHAKGVIILENLSGEVQRNIPYDITTTLGNIIFADTIATLLPFQHYEIPFAGIMPFATTPKNGIVHVSVGGEKYNKSYTSMPYIVYGVLLSVLLLSICIILYRRKKYHD